MNVIHNRQFAVLIFIIGIAFKVVYLPAMVAKSVGSGGALLLLLYLVIEAVAMFAVLKTIELNGMKNIEKNANKILYYLLLGVLTLYFSAKLILSFVQTIIFIDNRMFENAPALLLGAVAAIPIAYMAYKGISGIARTAECFIYPIILALIFILLLVKTELNFDNNLPVLPMTGADFINSGNGFWFWFGDFTPFLLITVKKGKKNYVPYSVIAAFLLVIINYVLIYAIYGKMSIAVYYPIVKIAAFNTFSELLGRLDWVGIFAWLIIALIYIGLFMWAAVECTTKIFKKSKNLRKYIVGLFTAGCLAVLYFVSDLSKVIELARTNISYAAMIGGAPLCILVMAFGASMRKKGGERLENLQ